MRILVVTDTWRPQVNGIVRTLESIAAEAPALGAEFVFLTPASFRTVGLPSYPEIRLSLTNAWSIADHIEKADADHIHVATEGPLGFAARRYCVRRKIRFSTSYHTKLPEYLAARLPVPTAWTYRAVRTFHNAGAGTFVSTGTLETDLQRHGFKHLMRWSLGVDHTRFRRRPGAHLNFPRPIFLYVGRLAVEKNLSAFLSLDLPGTKLVVGDGPARAALEKAHPDAHFAGNQTGECLANIYSGADAFVFPSLTDTFGLVLLEAMASGLPIAAFPVAGALDLLSGRDAGVLDFDLRAACLGALAIPRERVEGHAAEFTWRRSAKQFLDNVARAALTPEAVFDLDQEVPCLSSIA